MTSHAERAARFVADPERARRHDQALWHVRAKRDRAMADVPEWELLRERAAAIKAHTVSQLRRYLLQFEARATDHGAVVHWAIDAEEHNRIVLDLLRTREVTRVVKSKSMLTEECGLNPFLERHGVTVTDTDLGERIVQLRDEPPSHIVLPAVHLRRRDIGDTFARHLGTPPGEEDPEVLTGAARTHLRERFLSAQAGITGVNFAVAETGGLVVCTNEGNADLGMALPPLHIACMGLEKLVPRVADLAVLLRLLARSATGQAITAYTSHVHGPRPDGELHVVIVDNGRSGMLTREAQRDVLRCIRCGACMNTCPVFRRSGGHSYATTVPGPLGSVLAPARDPEAHASLPLACSLCASCSDVCPVKIPLHRQLLAWRHELRSGGALSGATAAVRLAAWLLHHPRLYAAAGWLARVVLRRVPGLARRHGPSATWGQDRELPSPPSKSFRQALRERRR